MTDQFISLLSASAIVLSAYGLGRPLLRGLKLDGADRLTTVVWSVASGMILAGLLLAGLGLIGALYVPLIGVLSATACFWGIRELVGGYVEQCEAQIILGVDEPEPVESTESASWAPPAPWLRRSVLGLAALACVGSLVAALAPPTAGDALCYHLELPKVFLTDHAMVYQPFSENSTFPMLTEMWFLWGLALEGGVTAQLVHWMLGVLLALATVVLARPIVGRPWASIAGAVVLLVPGVNNQMTAPLNDVALALLTTLALAAWWRAVINEENRRWFLLAGLAAGGALSTKYVALLFALAMAIPCLWMFMRQPRRRRLLVEGVAIVAVVAVSVAGLWYVRAAWHRGNPVYPFLNEVVATADTDPAPGEHAETLPASKSPLGRTPWGLTTAAWQVTMHPERFGGRGHQLGVVLLAALPGLFWTRRLRGLGLLIAVAACYGLVWFLLRQNVRFLLPAVPLATVVVLWVWIEMRRFPAIPRALATATFGLALVAYAAVAMARCGDQLGVALGLESRVAYLQRHEPTWPAADVARQLMPDGARLLSQDYRAFYFPCHVTRENVYRRQTHYDRKIKRPEDFARQLRHEGFTHLLLAENLSGRGIQYDPTLSRLADAQWATGDDQSMLKLTEYRFVDSDGGLRRYRLVMLR